MFRWYGGSLEGRAVEPSGAVGLGTIDGQREANSVPCRFGRVGAFGFTANVYGDEGGVFRLSTVMRMRLRWPRSRSRLRNPKERSMQRKELRCAVRGEIVRLRLAPSTVRETLKRFEASGLCWPLPNGPSSAIFRELASRFVVCLLFDATLF